MLTELQTASVDSGTNTISFLSPHHSERPTGRGQNAPLLHDRTDTTSRLACLSISSSSFQNLVVEERSDIRDATLSAWRTALSILSASSGWLEMLLLTAAARVVRHPNDTSRSRHRHFNILCSDSLG